MYACLAGVHESSERKRERKTLTLRCNQDARVIHILTHTDRHALTTRGSLVRTQERQKCEACQTREAIEGEKELANRRERGTRENACPESVRERERKR